MTARQGERIAFVVTSLRDGDDDPSKAWIAWCADAGYEVIAVPVLAAPVSSSLHPSVTVRTDVAVPGRRARVRQLSALIETEGIGTVISVRTYPNIVAVLAAKRLAAASRPLTVITEEAPLSLFLAAETPLRRRHVRTARGIYRDADLAISASHPVAAELTAMFGVPASRSLVVPRPVLAASDARRPAHGAAAGDGAVRLVLTCELSARTEPDVVVHAARSLRERGIRAEVLALRGGPREADLRNLADGLNVPFTVRHDADAPDWALPAGSVVVLPSRREGLGTELIEAASRAVPAAAISTALGVADAIIPGVTGELALDDDPRSIADAVDRASRITVGGIDDWIDRFTPQASGALLERALHYGRGLAIR